LVKNHVELKNIDLQQDVKDEILLNADRDMIDAVIRNLINNAIKFTESGFIKIEAYKEDGKTIVRIIDTGVGIDDTKLDNLFEIGSKSTRGTKGERGSGLGLILCKEFIERHGGTIWVKSEPGKGSEFSFSIPDQN
jgi:signal transduction histidine kinase